MPDELRARIRELCAAAVELEGVEGAQKLWEEALRDHRPKRGRPRKAEISPQETLILVVYDGVKDGDRNPSTLISYLAKEFSTGQKPRDGWKGWQSAAALERQLRRLLKDREAGKLIREETGHALPRYRRQ